MIAIDFFCGGGGLTSGLIGAGISVLGGYDSCPDYKDTYEKNNKAKFICADIRNVNAEKIYGEFPAIKGKEDQLLFSGCAPCQPFSSQRHAKTVHKDVNLLVEFGRIVEAIKPAHVFVENVPGIRGKGKQVIDSFIYEKEKSGYLYDYKVVNAKDYGVPQNRQRFVLIASRFFKPTIPEGTFGAGKTPYRTVRDAIAKFPEISAGGHNDSVPNHQASALSALNLERIQHTPHSGGDRRSWPPRLILKCHNNGHTGHTDVYGRMDWDKVAPTLTARCYSLSNGRYGHPTQNRAISLREAAALQSFSDEYVFYGTFVSIGRQIGNAVPVKMAEVMGKYIVRSAKNAMLSE